MTDDLVKRPVLRIYTEATSDKGGIWAFKPYTSAHTVFVEESNYLDLKDRIEALTSERDSYRKALEDIIKDYEPGYPLSHGAIKYAAKLALKGESHE